MSSTTPIYTAPEAQAAAMEIEGVTLLAEQSIEPTQVAGFIQFFDDAEGSDVWHKGIGLDLEISKSLYVGGEYTNRELDVPGLSFFPEPGIVSEDWDEEVWRAYLYWAPTARWSLRSEYHKENFSRNISLIGPEAFTSLHTDRLVFGANFFHPIGLHLVLSATYIDQEGKFGDFFGDIVPGQDQFWILDASLGYRLRNRLGAVSITAKNIFDENFNFQDTDPGNSTISPVRSIILRFSLSL